MIGYRLERKKDIGQLACMKILKEEPTHALSAKKNQFFFIECTQPMVHVWLILLAGTRACTIGLTCVYVPIDHRLGEERQCMHGH